MSTTAINVTFVRARRLHGLSHHEQRYNAGCPACFD